EMHTFSGRTIDVPSMFIGGKSDWGVYQTPGAAESMQKTACTRMVGFHLVDGAGHWVQQEQPGKVTELITKFLQDQSARDGQNRKGGGLVPGMGQGLPMPGERRRGQDRIPVASQFSRHAKCAANRELPWRYAAFSN